MLPVTTLFLLVIHTIHSFLFRETIFLWCRCFGNSIASQIFLRVFPALKQQLGDHGFEIDNNVETAVMDERTVY
jgi:hypothetical protein